MLFVATSIACSLFDPSTNHHHPLTFQVQEKKETKASFMSKLGDAMSNATNSFAKAVEVDEVGGCMIFDFQWFENKKTYVDNLDGQLKSLARSIDSLIKQREGFVFVGKLTRHIEDLGDCSLDFAESIFTLAATEISKNAERNLVGFGNIHKTIKSLQQTQAHHDLTHLANTIDEYIRIIGSIRVWKLTLFDCFRLHSTRAPNPINHGSWLTSS